MLRRMMNIFFDADKGGAGGDTTLPDTTVPPVETPKTFTQEDVNGLIKKEKEKVQESFLKELGLTDVKSAKEGIAEWKKMQDAQKSNEQKLADENKSLLEGKSTAEQKATISETKFAAVLKGVDPAKAERVAKLALSADYDGETPDARIEGVLKDFPEFLNASGGTSFGGQTKGQIPNADKALEEMIRNNMRL
jgi:hypothetical protein